MAYTAVGTFWAGGGVASVLHTEPACPEGAPYPFARIKALEDLLFAEMSVGSATHRCG